jgi:glucose uptake protein|tara:strand:+ start:403 stop:1251 length:849 start_codon:yes stop_codon:yes gene_type:complete
MQDIGLITAILAAIFWGSLVVPLKIAKKPDVMWFQLALALGALTGTIIIVPITGLLYEINLYGFISGIIWATGNVLAIKSIIKLGLARSTPIFVGISVMLSSTWGIVYFQETIIHLETALIGLALLLIGIIIVGTTQKQQNKQWVKQDIILAIAAGLVLGTQFVPMKMIGISLETILFPMALGIATGATIIFLVIGRQVEMKHLPHGLTSGWIFAIGNYFGIFTIASLGLTVGFPITQIAVLVSILWGIIYFKELPESRTKTKIIIAAILILTGSYVLASSI